MFDFTIQYRLTGSPQRSCDQAISRVKYIFDDDCPEAESWRADGYWWMQNAKSRSIIMETSALNVTVSFS